MSEETKRVRIYLVEEGSREIEATVDHDWDVFTNKPPSINIKENRMEIGYGMLIRSTNGKMDLKLTLAGNCTMASDNIPGETKLRCVIPARNIRNDDEESLKVLTIAEWMDELKRWWNYSVTGNMDAIKLTKEEFLNYMQRNGTEVTSKVPDKFKKKPE